MCCLEQILEKELNNFVDNNARDHREAIVILGEGGIGRSKILNAVTSKASALGVKVISTRLRVQDTDLMLKVEYLKKRFFCITFIWTVMAERR